MTKPIWGLSIAVVLTVGLVAPASAANSGKVRLVKDINPGTAASFPQSLAPVGKTLFFGLRTGPTGSSCGRAAAPSTRPCWSRTSSRAG
jgi:hypothetical protein